MRQYYVCIKEGAYINFLTVVLFIFLMCTWKFNTDLPQPYNFWILLFWPVPFYILPFRIYKICTLFSEAIHKFLPLLNFWNECICITFTLMDSEKILKFGLRLAHLKSNSWTFPRLTTHVKYWSATQASKYKYNSIPLLYKQMTLEKLYTNQNRLANFSLNCKYLKYRWIA